MKKMPIYLRLFLVIVTFFFVLISTETRTQAASGSQLWVDAVYGNDITGDGSRYNPFKTITHALDVAVSGQDINVLGNQAQVYDLANGEIFPLQIKTDVDLIGVGYPTIRGSGDEALRCADYSLLSGFTITNPEGQAIHCDSTSPTIDTNIITENMNQGIVLTGTSSATVTNNIISDNFEGLIVADTASPVITDNTFIHNGEPGLGGVAMIVCQSPSPSTPKILRNRFIANTGGISVCGSAHPLIQENIFSANMGNGISNGETSAAKILKNTITRNGYEGIAAIQNAAPIIGMNTITDNYGSGIIVNDSAKPILGMATKPGNNIIQRNGGVGLYNNTGVDVGSTAQTISAAGNTWNPDVQGADSNGHYTTQTISGPVPIIDGNNYAITVNKAKIRF